MSEDEEGVPDFGDVFPKYMPTQRMPITPNIFYNLRWRILNLKLLILDLEYLNKKGVKYAEDLRQIVLKEGEELCAKLIKQVQDRKRKRQKLSE